MDALELSKLCFELVDLLPLSDAFVGVELLTHHRAYGARLAAVSGHVPDGAQAVPVQRGDRLEHGRGAQSNVALLGVEVLEEGFGGERRGGEWGGCGAQHNADSTPHTR